MSSRIDVSIEHKGAPPAEGKRHPNTCPSCDSHFRDDELEANLYVCTHCGHHFPMRARSRIAWLADEGTFVEEASELRSEDPLGFFDLRPYTERLAEAELKTGLGDAMVIGQAELDRHPIELAVYLLRDDPRWDRDEILAALDDAEDRSVTLPEPMPIHLLYWTAWADADGTIQFRRDIHDRDPPLFTALRAPPPSKE